MSDCKDFKELLNEKGLKSGESCFTMANPNSGHTLIALHLAAHSKIIHLGDNLINKTNLGRKFCSCGKLRAKCQYWEKIDKWKHVEELKSGLRRSPLRKILLSSTALNTPNLIIHRLAGCRFSSMLVEYHGFIRDMFQKPLFIDGTKRPSEAFCMASCGYPVKIIHITKSPLNFVTSRLKRSEKYYGTMPEEMIVKKASAAWRRYNKKVLHLKKNPRIVYHSLRFEDFITNPKISLESLCEFLGVDFEESMLCPSCSGIHHLIGARSVVKGFGGIKPMRSEKNTIEKKWLHSIRNLTEDVSKELHYHL